MQHLIIKVTGKVQGVFFRDSTRSKARELGIRGFVRNEQDGSVYIEAEGGEDVLNKFTDWCRKGPELARVDSLEVNEGAIKYLEEFEITL